MRSSGERCRGEASHHHYGDSFVDGRENHGKATSEATSKRQTHEGTAAGGSRESQAGRTTAETPLTLLKMGGGGGWGVGDPIARRMEYLAKQAGGVATVQAGTSAELRLKDKKHRVEVALRASRVAAEEGIVRRRGGRGFDRGHDPQHRGSYHGHT
jgi:hypothetical protein